MTDSSLNSFPDIYKKPPKSSSNYHLKYNSILSSKNQPSLSRYYNNITHTTTSCKTEKKTTPYTITVEPNYNRILTDRNAIHQTIPSILNSSTNSKHSASTIYVDHPIITKRFQNLHCNYNNNFVKKIRINKETIKDVIQDSQNVQVSKSCNAQRKKLYRPKYPSKSEINELNRKKYLMKINSLLFSKHDESKVDAEVDSLGQSYFIRNEITSRINMIKRHEILNYENNQSNNEFLYKEIKLEPLRKRHFAMKNPVHKAKLLHFFKKIDTISSLGKTNQ